MLGERVTNGKQMTPVCTTFCAHYTKKGLFIFQPHPVMFYCAKWRAMVQTTLPFYQPILPPHRLSREAELIAQLFALESRCTNRVSQDALWCLGKHRGETKVMFTKKNEINEFLTNSTHTYTIHMYIHTHLLQRYILNFSFKL